MIFGELLSLNDIKDPYVIEHIIWDIEPKDLMEPRCRTKSEGIEIKEPIKGYVFYIDTMDARPTLFMMRHTAMGYAETIAQINEISQGVLDEAVKENKEKAYFGMYPINKEVEEWLKRELGVL
ncbi:MAG: hypothetical protein QMD01_00410 [Thermodesulfovibrionales bacterium]|nr:hypothetical protein [Thermodesulfovibrionales bacterium]